MNVQTKNQNHIRNYHRLHCRAPSAELLQSYDAKSHPTQETVAVWTSFEDASACHCEHSIATDILESRILDFPPPVRMHRDLYASPPACSRTGQIHDSLYQIMDFLGEGRRISQAQSLPIKKYPSRQDDAEVQLWGNLGQTDCWKLHAIEEASGWSRTS